MVAQVPQVQEGEQASEEPELTGSETESTEHLLPKYLALSAADMYIFIATRDGEPPVRRNTHTYRARLRRVVLRTSRCRYR